MSKEELLTRALEDLGKRYPIGLYEYLFKHRPEKYKQLLELEDRIDVAYLTGTLDSLKSVLREYWTFHMAVIKEFKQAEQLGLNLSQVRQEMTEERVRA